MSRQLTYAVIADGKTDRMLVPIIQWAIHRLDPEVEILLERLLFEAAGSPAGRRGKNFKRSIVERRVSVAGLISDFGPLEDLPAFRTFQKSLSDHYPYPMKLRQP